MKVQDIRNAVAGKTNRPPEVRRSEVLGMDLNIKHLSAFESDSLQVAYVNDDGKVEAKRLTGARARLIAACVVDDEGNAAFTSADVNAWDNDLVAELNELCRDVNKIGKEKAEAEEKH